MRKLTTEEFIEKASKLHEGKYSYDKVNYIKSSQKIVVICPIHGDFEVTPNNHLSRKSGCNKCGVERTSNKQRKSIDDFILESNIVHDNFYSYQNAVYDSARRPITITCPIHGDFEQLPTNHLKGVGCPSCHGGVYNASKPTILYYLSINNGEAYKIGITCQGINTRFSAEKTTNIEVIKFWEFPEGKTAYTLEQEILKLFNDKKYLGEPLLLSGNTELFCENILESIEKYLQK